MDFALNDDQRAFQDSARDFAQNELAPFAAEWDAEAQLAHLPLYMAFCL